MTSDVERFSVLFAGRKDAFGTEEGGCIRTPDADWLKVCDWHLRGQTPIGVYPMVPLEFWKEETGKPRETLDLSWHVKWGCVDLDVKREGKRRWDYDTEIDAHAASCDLREALRLMDITGWIEITRSHGRHVWVFAEDWVPASSMRRALLVACAVAAVPPTEVNPKAEGFDDPSKLGNYVRLPYPGGAVKTPPDRFVVNDGAQALPLSQFLYLAETTLATEQQIRAAAALWQPPPQREPLTFAGEQPEVEALRPKLSNTVILMLDEGPLEGHFDRSAWLFSLASRCCDDGLMPEEAYVIVKAADEAWTQKYSVRRDGDTAIERTVERAYR